MERAREYLIALEILAEHLSKSILPPIGLIASQAIELGLKAFLLNKGWTESEVKKVGHNLEKLWKEATKAGLRINGEHKFSVDVLSLSHDAPFLFRYPQDKVAVAITEPAVLCLAVKAIIDSVEDKIFE